MTNAIVAVIPAHNEEAVIGAALESLAVQTRLADEVIVIADRCHDRTREIALAQGAAVIETIDNHHQILSRAATLRKRA